MPSFFVVLLNKAPFFILSLIILIIFSLLRLNMRIGPLYKLQDNSSRNILEHLTAAGHFIRKHDKKTNSQIDESRVAIEKNIAARHLYFERKTPEERYELISRWANIPAADVNFAFTEEAKTSEKYIKITMILQKINVTIQLNSINMNKRQPVTFRCAPFALDRATRLYIGMHCGRIVCKWGAAE